MASTMVPCGHSAHNGSGPVPLAPKSLLSIGAAAEFIGVHVNTLRNWSDAGEISTVVLPSGHRRYRIEDLREYLGEDRDGINEQGSLPIALVARVSSRKQSKGHAKGESSDLSRQEDRLWAYARDHWGDGANVKMYSRTSSGMNFEDPTFLRLINDLLSGRFRGGYVVAVHPERICRFGLAMVREIANKGGAELMFIGEDAEKNEYETLADDILAIMCHFSAKTYGKRSAETCRKEVDADCVSRMIQLRQSNWSLTQIAKQLEKEGYRTSKDTPVSRFIIQKYLDQNGVEAALTTVIRVKDTPLLDKFLETQLVVTKDPKDVILIGDLHDAYAEFCEKHGGKAEPRNEFGKLLAEKEVPRGRVGKNRDRAVVGVRLAGNIN